MGQSFTIETGLQMRATAIGELKAKILKHQRAGETVPDKLVTELIAMMKAEQNRIDRPRWKEWRKQKKRERSEARIRKRRAKADRKAQVQSALFNIGNADYPPEI
jgi:hypothetical protein